ncbi:hypothetical protein [Rheinheimera sp.]|uniref:hypothetical protein n=1 Tax=Rheinheimera sp. TaxID=1869214 RepID=UPI0040471E31
MKIKRSLNVEHKHYDFHFGSGRPTIAQQPTNQTPIVLALPVPERGVAFNNRVGNQIKITHISSKLQFFFKNNQDLIGRTSCSVRLLFAKSGADIPNITDLYQPDANGHYTRNSFTQSQNWKKYAWIKPLNSFKSHTDMMPRQAEDATIAIRIAPSTQSIHDTTYYVNKSAKVNIKMMFENGSDTDITQMKPYLLFMSDTIQATTNYDPVLITGTIRFTYVDN